MADDVWDDWEEGYEAEIQQAKEGTPNRSSVKMEDEHERNKKLWERANSYVEPEIIRTDTIHTQFVPQMKILKRPKAPEQAAPVSVTIQKKTLAEREAEYLAAREKIFGTTIAKENESSESIVSGQSRGKQLAKPKEPSKPVIDIVRQPRGPTQGGFGKG
ncbi:uncharacterized protein VTP21DRAFT_2631 [Calcarisporiella thermophila]|uniref:uncharacterized protein n=1 Tax=Calcarisporiella thermophila TaxID=911321 RepID=UPI0037433A44